MAIIKYGIHFYNQQIAVKQLGKLLYGVKKLDSAKGDAILKKIKHDLRYIKTEKAIRKTFHELLQEKDISRITVKELTERAEINKTTFYAHYETLPDLVNTLETENIDYIINNLDQVQLLFTNSDFFIDNLYRNLKDCNIAKISQNKNRNVAFLQKLKERIEKELEEQQIHPEDYKKIVALLLFVFHGILGIANADIDDEITLNTIKLFVKNGISVNNLNRENSVKY